MLGRIFRILIVVVVVVGLAFLAYIFIAKPLYNAIANRPAATKAAPTAAADAKATNTAGKTDQTTSQTGQTNTGNQTGGQHVTVNGIEMGLVDPQMQQVHSAAFYLATGVEGKNEWSVEFPNNAVLIVGGVEVNGTSGGVYQAFDKSPQKVSITNGFALVTLSKWANWEFCFRVYQAELYGWAHNMVMPLTGWVSCSEISMSMNDGPTVSNQSGVTATGTRQETGQDAALRFNAGDSVFGWKIVLDDGQMCDGGECYLPNAPMGGTVTSGVINPWPGEVPSTVKPWEPK